MTYELNNLRKDAELFDGKFKQNSPVVEVFKAMVNGEEVSKFGAKADKAVNYIKSLGELAGNGDTNAAVELNTLRRFVIDAPIMEEIKLLGIFGSYTPLAYDDSIEREVTIYSGERARGQANGGDIVFPVIGQERYTVGTQTISGGYAVDYRRVALGDMSKENEGMEQVRKTIRNKAMLMVINKVYDAIQKATGVKYMVEDAGLTKTNVDAALTKIRRWGRPTVIADYAILSQFTPWAGYVGTVNSNTILGISDKTMDELSLNGLLSVYNGAILSEMQNPYDVYGSLVTDADGNKNFPTLLPAGLGFIIPTGTQSPIQTWTRGGLTSFTGNNVQTGKVETRFDLEVAADVAKTQEFKVGTIYDTNIGGLD